MQTLGRTDQLTISGKDKNAERKLRYFCVQKDATFPGVFAALFYKEKMMAYINLRICNILRNTNRWTPTCCALCVIKHRAICPNWKKFVEESPIAEVKDAV